MAAARRSRASLFERPLEVTKRTPTPDASSAAWSEVALAGAASLRRDIEGHVEAVLERGIGRFYGGDSEYAALPTTGPERKEWARRHLKPGAARMDVHELVPSNCLHWAMRHLEAAYRAAGLGERWEEIYREVAASGGYGHVLAAHLAADGWSGIYLNPDRTNTRGGGEHSSTLTKPVYYGVAVFDRMLDYQREGSRRDRSGIQKLEEVPFYFGFFRGGDHVFVGSYGAVNDLHVASGPEDPNLIGTAALETSEWWSGMVLVPPGSWPEPRSAAPDTSGKASGRWRRPGSVRRPDTARRR